MERAATKRKLERLIIQSGKFRAASQRERSFQRVVNEDELLALLNQRDHHREHRASQGHGGCFKDNFGVCRVHKGVVMIIFKFVGLH